jgi:ABC-type transporter Mla MlaB component
MFGFFRKKGDSKDASQVKVAQASRPVLRQQGPPEPGPGGNLPDQAGRERLAHVERASATARKIDAIESEMSSELSSGQSGPGTPPAQAPSPFNDSPRPGKNAAQVPVSFESTLPSLGMSTEFLLGVEGKAIPVPLEIVGSETAQVIEEAAILFANGQTALVEEMLRAAIADGKPEQGTKEIWWMLFDLYQITGQQLQFESLSVDYASRFETSPPSWVKPEPGGPVGAAPVRLPAAPTVTFPARLDAGIIKLLERAMKLGENSQVLRLEFARVTEVAPVGCGLLLRILKKLQDTGHQLTLVGAAELAARIRAILQVGRRDETEAPWLLLLEILRLLNREKEFEETSIDYCVTFEVSPPAFSAPGNKVTMASDDAGQARQAAGSFTMPSTVEGRTEQLMSAIAAFAASHDPSVLDCSRLDRIDFSGAGQLLGCLAPLSGRGKAVEFHGVNYLVAALFNIVGLRDVARILPRKT